MSLRDDVTQPVSLADELRTLAEKWRRTYEEGQPIGSKGAFTYDIEKRCADELSALLAQHVVAEPQRAFVCPSCGKTFSDISYAPNGILCPDCPPAARAAEQPKLTEGSVCAILLEEMASVERDGLSAVELNRITERLNALLTSPVAPGEQPPRNPYENAICNHRDRNNPNHVHTHACPQGQPPAKEPRAQVEFDQPIIGSDGAVQTGWKSVAPAQERASDETLKTFEQWWFVHGHTQAPVGTKSWAEQAWATAAKQAREEAFGEAANIVESYSRIKDAVAVLRTCSAAQPSPQKKENGK